MGVNGLETQSESNLMKTFIWFAYIDGDVTKLFRSPTALDAWLYALITIILSLPMGGESELRGKVERCPTLVQWLKSKSP